MMPEVITAIIALVGVILSVTVSFIVSMGVKRYNYHQLFAETVSQSRNRWLNEMRDYISTIIEKAKSRATQTEEYQKARAEVLLRLNKNETYHVLLAKEIRKLDNPQMVNTY